VLSTGLPHHANIGTVMDGEPVDNRDVVVW
jgi:hypothetical protein